MKAVTVGIPQFFIVTERVLESQGTETQEIRNDSPKTTFSTFYALLQ